MKKFPCSPIALFVYARPFHTSRVLTALKNNYHANQSDLIVFSDGASNCLDYEKVEQVRKNLREITGFRSVQVIEREFNYGLEKNIIDGVTQICSEYGRVIVLEDDLLTSRYFLKFMNEALDSYADNERVASVHGYCFPLGGISSETFFLRGADCWGWATWYRAWKKFNPDGQALLQQLRQERLTRLFDFNGAYGYTNMLEQQTRGQNHSWAIRWYASMFLEDMLTLYPCHSLVQNIGNDNSGTHCGQTSFFEVDLYQLPVRVGGIVVEDSKQARLAIEKFYRRRKSSLQYFKKLAKKIAKNWLPYTLITFLKRCKSQETLAFAGFFEDWENAKEHSSGYNSDEILDKVKTATLMVKSGQVAYERDSVIFSQIEYSWPVLSGLMWAASQNHGSLRVLDFGGSLGSSYFQNRKFFMGLKEVKWGIVEQSHFATWGKEEIQDESLLFFQSIDECVTSIQPNVILLSSVLQYLPNPMEILTFLRDSCANIMLIDRTPFSSLSMDKITVQKVPSSIYRASYPMWIFSKVKFLSKISKSWALVEEFVSNDSQNFSCEDIPIHFNGFIMMRKHD